MTNCRTCGTEIERDRDGQWLATHHQPAAHYLNECPATGPVAFESGRFHGEHQPARRRHPGGDGR